MTPHEWIAVGVLALLYSLHHGKHYRHHRRAGFGFWWSMRGPFGGRTTISERWRL